VISGQGEITCIELVELITAYLEDALPPADRLRFEQHLVVCEGCSAYLGQMRDTIRATGRLREEDLGDGARQALLRAFRNWRQD
jgi:anti-sigma factor RsiW